jgi:dTDP-4-dehydrorhamnose 3,5-epimerase
MKIHQTPIADLVIIESTSCKDERGAFTRFFCERELLPIIGNRSILQINHSSTQVVGTVRGLHFQYAPNSEMKFVRCLKGRIWDVAVDLRPSSRSYLKWHAEELSSTSGRMMVIPEGFAHGFQVLEAGSELLYLHTAFYSPESEDGLRSDDPLLDIKWPLNVANISQRDNTHPYIDETFSGIVL